MLQFIKTTINLSSITVSGQMLKPVPLFTFSAEPLLTEIILSKLTLHFPRYFLNVLLVYLTLSLEMVYLWLSRNTAGKLTSVS